MSPEEALWVFLISAAPIVELRGAIPIAIHTYDISWYYAFPICFAGNLLPVPFLLLFFDRLPRYIANRSIPFLPRPINSLFFVMAPLLEKILNFILDYTRRRGGLVEKYGSLGLILFVGIPLPGTGAWTGSIIAFLLGLDFKPSFYCILIGIIIAGIIVTFLSLLGWIGAVIAGAVLFSFIILNFWRRIQK